MLQWLRRVLCPSHDEILRLTGIVAELSTRIESLEKSVTKLKASELDREVTTAETIEKLERLFKRYRQRQVFDARKEEPKSDPITELVLKRRRAGAGPTTPHNGD